MSMRSEPRDILPFFWRWLAMGIPLCAALLSGACFYVLGAAGAQVPKQIDWGGLLAAPAALEMPEAYAARTMWFASAYSLLVLSASLLVVTALVTIESIAQATRPLVRLQLGVIVGAGLLAGSAVLLSGSMDARPVAGLLMEIERHSGDRIRNVFRVFDCSYPLTSIIVAIGFCATLLPVAEGSRDARVLSRALARQRLLLYTVALVLAVAVAEMNFLWAWPRAWALEGGAAARIAEMALRVSAGWGSIFTIFILVVFSSSHLVLQAWINRYLEEQCPDPKERLELIKSEGLESSWSEQLSKALAVLGPALAGGPLAALLQSLGSTK